MPPDDTNEKPDDTNTEGRNGAGAGGQVPSARLREETAAKRKALARVSELESMLEDSEKRGATADTLAQQVAELKAASKKDRESWDTERAVYSMGITDPEAIDLAKYFHGKLPEAGRPPLPDYLKGLKEDVSKAPKALAAYLTPAASTTVAEGKEANKEPEKKTPAQGAPAGGRPAGGQAPNAGPPATGSQFSPEQIRALKDDAVRTKDWSKYREARAALGLPPLKA